MAIFGNRANHWNTLAGAPVSVSEAPLAPVAAAIDDRPLAVSLSWGDVAAALWRCFIAVVPGGRHARRRRTASFVGERHKHGVR